MESSLASVDSKLHPHWFGSQLLRAVDVGSCRPRATSFLAEAFGRSYPLAKLRRRSGIRFLSFLYGDDVHGDGFLEGPLVAFDGAQASSTYSQSFDAGNANDTGSRYWCSDGGQNADESVLWTGYLKYRQKIKGLEIDWAYGPEEIKILTSPDGENFEDAVCWQKTTTDAASYKQWVSFENWRNVKAVTIVMRGTKPWKYFGINHVGMVSNLQDPVALINGTTAKYPTPEQCLVVKGEGQGKRLTMGSCVDVGDGSGFFRFEPGGRLKHVGDGLCVTAPEAPEEGREVELSNCKDASQSREERSGWYMSRDAQLRLSSYGNSFCLFPTPKKLVLRNCERASHSSSAEDKWFLSDARKFALPEPSPPAWED